MRFFCKSLCDEREGKREKERSRQREKARERANHFRPPQRQKEALILYLSLWCCSSGVQPVHRFVQHLHHLFILLLESGTQFFEESGAHKRGELFAFLNHSILFKLWSILTITLSLILNWVLSSSRTQCTHKYSWALTLVCVCVYVCIWVRLHVFLQVCA